MVRSSLVDRIHRLTLNTLRKQIEPITASVFIRWLAHWQHVAPGTQLTGERGTLAVLRQLQGFEIPANAWERQILGKRIANYDPTILDRLCLTGAVGWGRLSPHPALTASRGHPAKETAGNHTANANAKPKMQIHRFQLSSDYRDRHQSSGISDGNGDEKAQGKGKGNLRVAPTSVAPITFFVREDAAWMTARHPELESEGENVLSHAAKSVKDFLRQRGASFFADIVRASGLLKAEVETGLWELVAAGLVTADGFDNLRALIDPSRRLGRGRSKRMRPRDSTGRWSLLYTEDAGDRNRQVEATCWMLLHRYGVVFRDILARESVPVKWRELLHALRMMEARGEIRGGRFVAGFLGEQFALPNALDSLRAFRSREPLNRDLLLSAADPLNLIGIIIPGDRVAALAGTTIALPG